MKSVICGLGSLLVALPCYVAAQDLGALAAKERERRKEQAKALPTPARVVTDDDLASEARRRGAAVDEADGAAAPGATASPTPADATPPGVEAAEKLREVLAENQRQQLATELRRDLRRAEDAVRAAERTLDEARRAHDKVPMTTGPYDKPFAARHAAEERVDQARRALEAAKERRSAIEDEASNAGINPDDLR